MANTNQLLEIDKTTYRSLSIRQMDNGYTMGVSIGPWSREFVFTNMPQLLKAITLFLKTDINGELDDKIPPPILTGI